MQNESFDIPLQAISDELTRKCGVNLYILRADLNHPQISGNKRFKLKYNLEEARKQGKETLLTFGGAFSNHIAATAAAGKEQGFKTIGIIRGDRTAALNPTLRFAEEQGMQLHFVSREAYRQKDDPGFLNSFIAGKSTALYIIPEGGANRSGIKGCMEITDRVRISFDHICCPCGTGTTLAGIILSLERNEKALGFQVLKGAGYMHAEVQRWLDKWGYTKKNWSINEDHHFGGYAKIKPELSSFMEAFEKTHKVPLDFIYTGKMMYGIYELIQKGYFKEGEIIVAVHTGGLQGNAGFQRKI
jgi:1-aminocyclopropane-1-carboxylate deaminase/D-cysteine desulfhydrase-like pyridoxal-dependent ACC family enzyme